ncbi:acetyl/propionyl/methylcrotonyl-CoA carboxylase subunit alpha [Roseateles toxinivorans]|uniref:Geranyl-CoA carboxylase alpha subunit n=1 Tax=Roseateles toxinivorans TaxID=270368 RepID=A0A4R6QCI7_9BURK|nr:biotin carboxylase N-terminal domain-containing protein [Roseateles toxinivorans]TDP59573.1 geranyl-CoA carboxylase alpha subunit [Roseateles toxinivorans]
MTRIARLMVANRGEIVARVARTAKAMGVHTIAVYSDADRNAVHPGLCDSAVAIGGERPADSYLSIPKLLEAARASGAQAVHPGYGFLSENAVFAQAVLDAGLVWVGPPPAAMAAMGNKSAARQAIGQAGVPVLPGYDGSEQDLSLLAGHALRIGFPLMVKAASGGGGRGMRLVLQADQLEAALQSAGSEAVAAFGDGQLLLERALLAPRHVEIQIFADQQGQVVHLGERDCSVQRRHQKVVEEAPSPAVTPALRRSMGEAAVQVARSIGYVGAGTVEFLLDTDGSYWFMEMNTRLQVEHPVTEALTGIDLVEWQLRIAQGEPLPLDQDELLRRFEAGGHAIEVRLCAEDPGRDYLPQAGRLLRWQPPSGIRCDHALADGLDIAPFYDSMLAKLIAHAPTRIAAAAKLADALDRTLCLGLATNRGLLARILRDDEFLSGDFSTALLARRFPDDVARQTPLPGGLQALAAAAVALLPATPLPDLWADWSRAKAVDQQVPLVHKRWQLLGIGSSFTASCGDETHRITDLRLTGPQQLSATLNGRPLRATRVRDGNTLWLMADGVELAVEDHRLSPAPQARALATGAVLAPMHGRLVQLNVRAGDTVQAGALMAVMEAMKMEHQLTAPISGVVGAVHIRLGEQVAARKLLLEVMPP